jgi:hypothetical protein
MIRKISKKIATYKKTLATSVLPISNILKNRQRLRGVEIIKYKLYTL